MNRRTVLKAGLVIAASSHTAVATAETSAVASLTIDDFLAKASPSERANFHADALVEVMGEMHPDHKWIAFVDHEGKFSLIVGSPRAI